MGRCVESNTGAGRRPNRAPDLLFRFRVDERGGTAIEYGLVCGLIFLAVVTAVAALGDATRIKLWEKAAKAISDVVG